MPATSSKHARGKSARGSRYGEPDFHGQEDRLVSSGGVRVTPYAEEHRRSVRNALQRMAVSTWNEGDSFFLSFTSRGCGRHGALKVGIESLDWPRLNAGRIGVHVAGIAMRGKLA